MRNYLFNEFAVVVLDITPIGKSWSHVLYFVANYTEWVISVQIRLAFVVKLVCVGETNVFVGLPQPMQCQRAIEARDACAAFRVQ